MEMSVLLFYLVFVLELLSHFVKLDCADGQLEINWKYIVMCKN